jgi:tRNA(Ile)-lysidine synthase
VLLHLLWQARTMSGAALNLRAVHVDHGLQPAAADFRRFCQRTARQWHVPLTLARVKVKLDRGASLEEAARDARRAALASALQPGELLVTAQHADDQLESVLLALLRGAGPAGLAGMPAVMPFGGSHQLRPLLGVERAAILGYAQAQGLAWIDDPSNADARFDRNYLRTAVLPVLRRRWPAAARTVGRSARHCAAAQLALEAAAAADLDAAADGAALDLAVLRRFSAARRAAVLRAWIARGGFRAPNERHLHEIEVMFAARRDAHPRLSLPGFSVQRRGNRLVIESTPVNRTLIKKT